MGKILVKIPIDPFLSRAIIEGIIFDRLLQDDKYKGVFAHLSEK